MAWPMAHDRKVMGSSLVSAQLIPSPLVVIKANAGPLYMTTYMIQTTIYKTGLYTPGNTHNTNLKAMPSPANNTRSGCDVASRGAA